MPYSWNRFSKIDHTLLRAVLTGVGSEDPILGKYWKVHARSRPLVPVFKDELFWIVDDHGKDQDHATHPISAKDGATNNLSSVETVLWKHFDPDIDSLAHSKVFKEKVAKLNWSILLSTFLPSPNGATRQAEDYSKRSEDIESSLKAIHHELSKFSFGQKPDSSDCCYIERLKMHRNEKDVELKGLAADTVDGIIDWAERITSNDDLPPPDDPRRDADE